MMMRRLRALLFRQEGNAAVEFAFVGPLLFLSIFGLFELGRLYLVRSSMQYAADEAGRYVAIHATAGNSAIEQEVSDKLLAVDPQAVTVTVQDQTIGGKQYKLISLSHNFSTVTGEILSFDTIPLSVQSTVPVVQ